MILAIEEQIIQGAASRDIPGLLFGYNATALQRTHTGALVDLHHKKALDKMSNLSVGSVVLKNM